MPDGQPAPFFSGTASRAWRVIPPSRPLRIVFEPDGDVQTGLCALAAAALANQTVPVWGVAECEPLISLRRILAQLGVQFVAQEDGWLNVVPPAGGFHESPEPLDCGTELDTLHVALGLVAGSGLAAGLRLRGEAAAAAALAPALGLLDQLGARFEVSYSAGDCQVQLSGGLPAAGEVRLPPSASDLKPMLLLAAQQLEGVTTLHEPWSLPDHAERALRVLGAQVSRIPHGVSLRGRMPLVSRMLKIPPDLSAGAALAVACAARAEWELALPMVGCNPGRTAWLRTLQRCGASVLREREWQFGTEPVCALRIGGTARLHALTLAPNAAGAVFPELPLLAVLATQCRAGGRLNGAALLRSTVPDRLALAAQLLGEFGAQAELLPDGLALAGPVQLHGAEVNCAGERSLAQLALAAALLAEGPSVIHGMQALERPWPGLHRAVQTWCGQTA